MTPEEIAAAAALAAAAAEAEAAAAAEAEAAETAAAEAAAAEALAAGKDAKTLAAENAKLVKEVMAKKAAAKTAAAEAETARQALAAYEGVDPAKVKALIAAEKAAATAAAEAAGDFAAVKAMMAEENLKVTSAMQLTIDGLNAAALANATLIDNLTVGNDFAGSVYIKDNLTLSPAKTRALFGAHFDMIDGKTVGFDKPRGTAGRTALIDAQGNNVSFDAAVERVILADPDKDSMLKVKVIPGTGAKTVQTALKDVAKADELYGASRIAASLNSTK